METDIRCIAQLLRSRRPELFLRHRSAERICGLALAENYGIHYRSDILYLASEEYLPALSGASISNLLIVRKDNSLPIQPPVLMSPANIVVVTTDESHEELLQYLQKQMTQQVFSPDYQKLISAAHRGNANLLLEEVYYIWGNPAFVHDTRFRVIKKFRGPSKDAALRTENYCDVEYLTDACIMFIHERKLLEVAARDKRPFFIDRTPMEHRILFVPIIKNDIVIAVLLIPEVNSDMNDEDLAIASAVGRLLSLSLQSDKEFLYPLGTLYDQFFKELVAGSYTDQDTVRRRLNVLKISLKSAHRIFVISSAKRVASETKLPTIIAELSNIVSIQLGMLYKDRIVILISDEAPCRLSGFQEARLRSFLQSNQLVAAGSHWFQDIFYTRQHYLQAVSLLDYILRSAIPDHIHCFEEYALRMLINTAETITPKHEFLHPAIVSVIEYDKKHNTEFLATLKAYVLNLKHINETAASLNIHRNTLFYRMKCIQDIYELDFNCSDTILGLMFSFKVLEEMKYDG